MIRPLSARNHLAVLAALVALGALLTPSSLAQQPPAVPAQVQAEGQFFTVDEPITTEVINRIRTQTLQVVERAASHGVRPILIFEIRPGQAQPGQTEFGLAQTLAEFISTKLLGADQTVAFVPEPISGYAALVALSCEEIVMAPEASIGPITPEGQDVDPLARAFVRILANRKGREADLLEGLLDRNAELFKVTTGDRQVHYVLAQNLPKFRETHQIADQLPAWEGGQRGVINGKRARSEGFCKRTAETRADVANIYNLAGQAASDDPTLDQVLNPVWIKISGPLDTTQEFYLKRRIEQARQDKVNLIFFEINSEGGKDNPVDNIADTIAGIRDMKTVAYIADRAKGVSSLIPLACNKIIFRKDGEMGEVTRLITGRNGETQELGAAQIEALASKAEQLAKQKGHPPAVARAMIDPEMELFVAKDTQTGAVTYVSGEQIRTEPGRYLNPERTDKKDHEVLTITANDALGYRLASDVVDDDEQLKAIFGLRGKNIRIDGPTWVDEVVTVLNTDWMSWLLLFIGFFMLVLELKLPGIGLPAIISALAFLLFFWSRYLSGTADQLEILLFVVGLICLALELFVFPGFGVFGMSGILLILISVVMASHTFVWPTQEYEYRQMGQTLLQVTVVLITVAAGAVMLGRYFPSLPFFNRMVLKPEPAGGGELDDPGIKPPPEGDDSLAFLVGETGRTTTVLRPTGKARFGELLVDVTADGFFIEPDSLVEVVEVRGARVIVKRV
ncbi:MAG TPA: NfeD family protein [Isosphaeraceae bacterium]|nr:NfeD family protein [Isosphaeraceae bacterium]